MEGKRITKEIEASIKKGASVHNISKVLVALSGGPDSVGVTFALQKAGFNVIALHCNFHLRGFESDRDNLFVTDFCEDNNIKLRTIDFNVPEFFESHPGYSIEMACRELRYEWFDKNLSDTGFDRIVTGHNADDNIETFFLNMLRGSGSRGLKGMLEDTGRIWRPFLKFHREDILMYLRDNGLNYIVDSSNLKSDYRRNYIRNKIIPLLKEEWKGFNKAMDTTIENLYYENKIVEAEIDLQIPSNTSPLTVTTILSFPAPLLLIKRYINCLGPYVQTPVEVLKAIYANKPHIRKWILKNGVLILRNSALYLIPDSNKQIPIS